MARQLIPSRERLPGFVGQIEKDVENLMERLIANGGALGEGFTPRTSIAETYNEFEVTVDLSGVKPKGSPGRDAGQRTVVDRPAQAGGRKRRQELPPGRATVWPVRAGDSVAGRGRRRQYHGPLPEWCSDNQGAKSDAIRSKRIPITT